MLQHAKKCSENFVVACYNEAVVLHCSVEFLHSSHDQAWQNLCISLRGVFLTLGLRKATPLLDFHALSGCDATGRLPVERPIYFTGMHLIQSLKTLLALKMRRSLMRSKMQGEAFICWVYHLKTNIMTLVELCWWMSPKKRINGEKLLLIRGAFICGQEGKLSSNGVAVR